MEKKEKFVNQYSSSKSRTIKVELPRIRGCFKGCLVLGCILVLCLIFFKYYPLIFLLLFFYIIISEALMDSDVIGIRNKISSEDTESTSHEEEVTTVIITPDGARLISASKDKTFKVRNLQTGKELTRSLMNIVNTMVASSDGKCLLSGLSDRTLKVWDVETGKKVLRLKSRSRRIYDAIRLILAIIPLLIYFFNPSLFEINNKFPFSLFIFTIPYVLLLAGLGKIDIDSVNAITATHNGEVVITGSKDKTLKGWDIRTKKQLFTLRGHQDEVTAVTVTSDDKLISGSKDKTLKVWNLKNRKLLFSLTGHDGWITAVAVTPDGKQLISSSRDRTIKVWNLESKQEEFALTDHKDKVTAVAITPDGKHLISASFDKTLKVWNLSKKKVIVSFVGESALTCCAVAPNGVTIVVGEASGRIHFLEWEGKELLEEPQHTG